jgi:pyruvate/oxaloacetate carboxyltransferase
MHFQGTICYSLTQRRMGGEVFNLEYYKDKARQLEEMGADTICVKDMAGLIAPYDCYELISTLKQQCKAPIHLHTHYTSGLASMSYLKAAEAGIDIVDCCLSPFALRTSQPAVEPLVAALFGTPRDTKFDLDLLVEMSDKLEEVGRNYKKLLDDTKMAVIDTGVLLHQVPGGMISNLVNQLKDQNAIHRLAEVYKEIPITRTELGTPPLVTPTSQIVGVQAVFNVLLGRYKVVGNETKNLIKGGYGQTPAPIDPEFQKQILGHEKPIVGRAADSLEPELDKLRAEYEPTGLVKTPEDLLTLAMNPQVGKEFLSGNAEAEKAPWQE